MTNGKEDALLLPFNTPFSCAHTAGGALFAPSESTGTFAHVDLQNGANNPHSAYLKMSLFCPYTDFHMLQIWVSDTL